MLCNIFKESHGGIPYVMKWCVEPAHSQLGIFINFSRNKFATICCQSCKYFQVLQQTIRSIWKKIWEKLSMWTGYQMDTVKNEELKKNQWPLCHVHFGKCVANQDFFSFFLMVWMTLHSIFFRWLFRNFDTVIANLMQLATT